MERWKRSEWARGKLGGSALLQEHCHERLMNLDEALNLALAVSRFAVGLAWWGGKIEFVVNRYPHGAYRIFSLLHQRFRLSSMVLKASLAKERVGKKGTGL